MKNSAIITAIAALLMISCDTSRMATSTDDVYVNPAEEKARQQAVAAERAKQEKIAREEAAQEAGATSAKKEEKDYSKDNSTPYYRDPEYNSDDYYDYEYASRINRFYNPIGVGYYDGYYTNMYTYTGNPGFYGTSIYSSYGYGMPSQSFGSISFGISSGWGYGGMNSCYPFYSPYYDPWCGGYNGYNMGWSYGYPYNNWGYMNGYNNGYYNGYYQGYYNGHPGYYNKYDVNSNYSKVSYGPRGSNVGGSPRHRDGSGIQTPGEHQKYSQSVAEQQENTPRFSNTGQRVMRHSQSESNTSGRPTGNNGGGVINSTPAQENHSRRNGRNRNSDVIIQRQDNQPSRRSEQPVINPGGDNGGGRNSGGREGSSPRNSNSGGSPRRR